MTGREARTVDNHQCPMGSYCCCQLVASADNRKISTAAMIATSMSTAPTQPMDAGGGAEVWDGFEVALCRTVNPTTASSMTTTPTMSATFFQFFIHPQSDVPATHPYSNLQLSTG